MNISAFTIYLWQLADKVCSISVGAAFFCAAIAFIVTGPLYCFPEDCKESTVARCKKLFRRMIALGLIMAGVNTFIPSSNTIAMMVVIPKIAESKVIQQDLPDLYNAAVEALKQQLKK